MERPGPVTFLFTDFQGSTEQLERLGDEESYSILTRALARQRQAALEHGGDVLKSTGDGLMIAFGSVLDALSCAMEMQNAARAAEGEKPDPTYMPLRIGLNTGEPIRAEGDYFGMAVNLASRMCSVARADQIVVSQVVRDLVGNRSEFAFRDLGERALSGIRAPVRLWEFAWDRRAPSSAVAPGENRPRNDARTATADGAPDTLVILFADIVDSVSQTEQLGDAQFRERARDLDNALRTLVRKHRGTAVDGKLVGDGVLAVFPSARNAIACALECGAAAASVQFELHLGIHAGDVIRDGNNIYGGAVNIAARICAASNPGEVLVSDTVRGLARTSGGVSFQDRGEHVLKGIDEPWRLFTFRV